MGVKAFSDHGEACVFKQVDHIGIAVRDLDDALNRWETLFGARAVHIETVKEHAVRVAFVPMGGVLVEFLEPTEAGAGVIGHFLERHGEGFNHIAFRVDALGELVRKMRKEGVGLSRLYHEKDEPRPGSRGSTIAFLDQGGTNDVLVELVEMKGE
jgi:methylmalonyl-CoA epimerase